MNITCTTEKLKNAVILAERMTGKTLTLPTLHALLLTATGKSLKIRATNLTLGIEVEIPATIEMEGMVLIKGEVLANVCNHLSDASEVRLTLDHDNLTIQTTQHTTIIKCLSHEEFPTLPVVEGEQIEVKTTHLQEGIRSVYFCAAVTDIKPEIASIFIYSEENTLCFVATDSFRLAEKKIAIKGIPEISKILIPYKNIADILRVLDVAPDTIRITYSRNQIAFFANGLYLTSRLIDGGFPPYQLIIPKETLTKVVLLKQELLNTLRLSTIFADKFFQVSFSIPEDKKAITLSSKNSDVGSSISIVSAAIEGNPIEVDFNLKYFLDVFQALSGDSVAISFTHPNKPIVVQSVSDTSFLYLLMPTNR
jgi:DNA polymerase-3 subunit beta